MALWRKRQDDRASLVVVSLGGREGLLPDYCHPLGDGVEIVGRGDTATIQVLDDQISRQHVQVRCDPADDSYYLSDLKSANGTILNGVRLRHEAALREGDVIEIGRSRLVFTRKRFKDHQTALRQLKAQGQRIKGTMVNPQAERPEA